MAQLVKTMPAMWETWVWSLGWVDPLKKEMAIHSNILAWRIPWVGLLCGCKELDMTEQLTLSFSRTFTHSSICIDSCLYVYLSMHWHLFMYLGMYPSIDIYIYVRCVVTQLCPTLSDPMDCSRPGSSVHGFSRQEYWSGLPFPSSGELPNPGIKPGSPTL